VARKRAPGGGRPSGSKTSDDKRRENYLKNPSREVANAVATATWPFMAQGRKVEIKPEIERAIEEWMRWTRLFHAGEAMSRVVKKYGSASWGDEHVERELDAIMRKVRKPNYNQVRALLRAQRTAIPTHRSYKRGPPIEITDDERRAMTKVYERILTIRRVAGLSNFWKGRPLG
jgi:hypothetical protein